MSVEGFYGHHSSGFTTGASEHIKVHGLHHQQLPGYLFLFDDGYAHFHLLHFELRFSTAGQYTVMADLHKSSRQDVKAKSPEELTGIKSHEFLFSRVFVIFIRKRYRSIGDVFEAVIGDGDAVRVSSEIFDHLLWPQKRLLGIHHPGLGVELLKQVRGQLYFFFAAKVFEQLHEHTPEDHAHDLDREEELTFGGRRSPLS